MLTLVANPTSISKELDNFIAQYPSAARRSLSVENESTHRLATDVLSNHGSFMIISQEADRLDGVAAVLRLEFDSSLYGINMGKIAWLQAAGDVGRRRSIKQELVSEAVRQAADAGFHHLSARVPASERDSIHALQSSGFLSMDVQVTLGMRCVEPEERADPSFTIMPFVAENLPHLLEFSTDSYAESRLFADPDLPLEKTKELYRRWVENDCGGRAAKVYVARIGEQPVGYIACLLHDSPPDLADGVYGDIDLIAVSPTARGRGIALALVRKGLAWFAARTSHVIVKTQVTNYPAIALYQRAGFVLQQAFESLHLSIKP